MVEFHVDMPIDRQGIAIEAWVVVCQATVRWRIVRLINLYKVRSDAAETCRRDSVVQKWRVAGDSPNYLFRAWIKDLSGDVWLTGAWVDLRKRGS